ncbi:MAG: hypothetical protein NT038_04010 [Euryarchaeota archaeon]|nr:hypothetical protein [Euryarchaeota archaeon]
MTKILYGVCGEGLGHASRSRILIRYLKKQRHEIYIVAGGKAYEFLSKEFTDITKIESARLFYQKNQVRLLPSIISMVYRTLIGSVPSFFRVRHLIREFKPNVVITDGDPICHYAARLTKGIKRISIDNPEALIYRKYPVAFNEILAWFTLYAAVTLGVFGAEKHLVYDFFDEPSSDKRVMFLKPLIQDGILRQKPGYGNHVFVYQTIDAGEDLLELLKTFDETFIIYGCNKTQSDGNLVFKQFNEDEFYHDIAQAKAVITNGGFTVISEALYLKKPVFCLPINNQFEQILNGKFVEKLGAGISSIRVNREKLNVFFDNLDQYKKNLMLYTPGNQQETLKQIEEEILSMISHSSNCK